MTTVYLIINAALQFFQVIQIIFRLVLYFKVLTDKAKACSKINIKNVLQQNSMVKELLIKEIKKIDTWYMINI